MKICILFFLVAICMTRRHNRQRIQKRHRKLNNNYYQNQTNFSSNRYQPQVASRQYFKDLVRHEAIDNAVFNNRDQDLQQVVDNLNGGSSIPQQVVQTILGQDYYTEKELNNVIKNNTELNRKTLIDMNNRQKELENVKLKISLVQRKVNEFMNHFEQMFRHAQNGNFEAIKFSFGNVQEELNNLHRNQNFQQQEQLEIDQINENKYSDETDNDYE